MLGATGSGTIAQPGKAMALRGTFIPALGLKFTGAIPPIGGIWGAAAMRAWPASPTSCSARSTARS
jgi:hypothetical protein